MFFSCFLSFASSRTRLQWLFPSQSSFIFFCSLSILLPTFQQDQLSPIQVKCLFPLAQLILPVTVQISSFLSGSEITSMWPTPASCISSVPSSPTPFSLASTVAFLLELPSRRFSSNSAASSQPSLSPAHHRIDKRSLSQTLNCTC